MTGILIMINNYFHDLSVAVLLISVLGAVWLGRRMRSVSREAAVEMGEVARRFRQTGWISLAFVIVFGAVRAANYRQFEWNTAVGNGQVAALVVKHILLVSITAVGIYQLVKLGREEKHGGKD